MDDNYLNLDNDYGQNFSEYFSDEKGILELDTDNDWDKNYEQTFVPLPEYSSESTTSDTSQNYEQILAHLFEPQENNSSSSQISRGSKRARKLSGEESRQFEYDYTHNVPIKDIAKKYHMDERTIHKIAESLNLPSRRRSRSETGLSQVFWKQRQMVDDKEQFKNDYNSGEPLENIAEKYRMTRRTVHKLAESLNLPSRKQSRSESNLPQVLRQMVDNEQFKNDYNSGEPLENIAEKYRMTCRTVHKLAESLNLPSRRQRYFKTLGESYGIFDTYHNADNYFEQNPIYTFQEQQPINRTNALDKTEQASLLKEYREGKTIQELSQKYNVSNNYIRILIYHDNKHRPNVFYPRSTSRLKLPGRYDETFDTLSALPASVHSPLPADSYDDWFLRNNPSAFIFDDYIDE